MKTISLLTKSCLSLAAGLLALAATTVPGQPDAPPQPTPPPGATARELPAGLPRPARFPGAPPPPQASEHELTRFDLDFPGGTPKEVVAAVQKALNRPLNAIVPDEYAHLRLPALRMKNVTVPQLFDALNATSRKTELVLNHGGPYNSYSQITTSYGFRTQENPKTDDSIWSFYAETPPQPPPPPPQMLCRFYSLAPYLERGFTVDDITTAIETGWKMLGEATHAPSGIQGWSTPPPATIRFHKDTKLLIAVGEPSKLETIDAVLKALEAPKLTFPGTPASGAKPAEQPKGKH